MKLLNITAIFLAGVAVGIASLAYAAPSSLLAVPESVVLPDAICYYTDAAGHFVPLTPAHVAP